VCLSLSLSVRVCVCVVCVPVTTITNKIADGFVPNFMGRFLWVEVEDHVRVSLRSAEGCGSNGQILQMAHYISRLEIAMISSSGTSLVGKTMVQECWYEFCCLGSNLYILLKTCIT